MPVKNLAVKVRDLFTSTLSKSQPMMEGRIPSRIAGRRPYLSMTNPITIEPQADPIAAMEPIKRK